MSGFLDVFESEIRAACHEGLVSGYVWAHGGLLAPEPFGVLRDRGEQWAQRVEAQGDTAVLTALEALYPDPE